MADEGVREIQLNGKQLVFLFMAVTVVSVVIFLCGVMVGRGVAVRAESQDLSERVAIDPTASVPVAGVDTASVSASGPVTADENLSYHELLDNGPSPLETLRPSAEAAPEPRVSPAVASPRVAPAAAPKPAAKPAVKPAAKPAVKPAVKPRATVAPRATAPPMAPRVSPAPRSALAPRAAAKPAAAAQLTEPKGGGFVVQVAAVRQRSEANAIARRLNGKGYPAFVTSAGNNFRVRVGKYPNRREADAIANRLKREERVEPWVTR